MASAMLLTAVLTWWDGNVNVDIFGEGYGSMPAWDYVMAYN